jgi:hypothetical protein
VTGAVVGTEVGAVVVDVVVVFALDVVGALVEVVVDDAGGLV